MAQGDLRQAVVLGRTHVVLPAGGGQLQYSGTENTLQSRRESKSFQLLDYLTNDFGCEGAWGGSPMLSTPSGRPASCARRASMTAAPGSCSDGFRTKVLPAVTAGGHIHSGTIAGKLNGQMPATTWGFNI